MYFLNICGYVGKRASRGRIFFCELGCGEVLSVPDPLPSLFKAAYYVVHGKQLPTTFKVAYSVVHSK